MSLPLRPPGQFLLAVAQRVSADSCHNAVGSSVSRKSGKPGLHKLAQIKSLLAGGKCWVPSSRCKPLTSSKHPETEAGEPSGHPEVWSCCFSEICSFCRSWSRCRLQRWSFFYHDGMVMFFVPRHHCHRWFFNGFIIP